MRKLVWPTLIVFPLFLTLASLFSSPLFAQKKPLDADTLLKIQRLGDPQISPDGKTVAFSVVTPDAAANNRAHSVWTVGIDGGAPKKIADDADRPRWKPDGKRIYYSSGKSVGSQIWTMNPDGSDARQITNLASEAANHLISSDSKYLVFTSDVYPDCGADDDCNAKHQAEEKGSKVKARLITSLLYRHWTQYRGRTRSHVLSMNLEDGKVVDLSPGDKDVPPFSLGGPDDYAVSPDSKEVCFTMNPDDVPAVSTNNELYVVAIGGGKAERITGNPGADNSPSYSPDGKYLAFRSQARGGYESDRWKLMVLERANGKLASPTDLIDRAVNSFIWATDSKRLFFTTVDRGRQSIQFVGIAGGGAKVAVSGNNMLDDMQFSPDGKTIVYTRQSGSSPIEICKAGSSGGTAVTLTHLNDDLLNQVQLTAFEEMWTKGAEDAQIQSFIVKPPDFNAAKKYPVLMLIHGGPQGEWGESWTYRWNAQVFAGAGYVVVMPNPRGSIGYGQKFTDDINQDWGGKAYEDVMSVTDAVANLPYVDRTRMAAAGGSYGGYMVNWILGHTDRFRCLISHAGVYDLRSEAEATEELWFPKWEFGGMPWETPEVYQKWSPSLFAREFKTPTLVIHGELDYRIPYTQGLQLFTALQLQKVPSQLLLYPDEGHWVLKPQNSLLWYKTFLEWINNWTK